jgi:hypothetical protein
VAFLFNKQITAYGTHEELLQTNPDYRRTVARALDEATSIDPARATDARSAEAEGSDD